MPPKRPAPARTNEGIFKQHRRKKLIIDGTHWNTAANRTIIDNAWNTFPVAQRPAEAARLRREYANLGPGQDFGDIGLPPGPGGGAGPGAGVQNQGQPAPGAPAPGAPAPPPTGGQAATGGQAGTGGQNAVAGGNQTAPATGTTTTDGHAVSAFASRAAWAQTDLTALPGRPLAAIATAPGDRDDDDSSNGSVSDKNSDIEDEKMMLEGDIDSDDDAVATARGEFAKTYRPEYMDKQWISVRTIGAGTFGVAQLWAARDNNRYITDRIAVKTSWTSADTWPDANLWYGNPRDVDARVPMEVKTMENLKGRRGGDKVVQALAWKVNDDRRLTHIIMNYCGVGDLEETLNRYVVKKLLIPEPFLWHVFDCLADACLLMKYGSTNREEKNDQWEQIVHKGAWARYPEHEPNTDRTSRHQTQ